MSQIANRLQTIKPSPTLLITNKAAELKDSGVDVIGLGAGELDADTPDHIKEAAYKAIRDGKTKYTAVDGIPDLKKAIVDKFRRENNLEYDVQNITVGSGGKHTLFNAIYATVNEGDEVVIPAPYWVSYVDIVSIAGGRPVIVEGRAENNFKITAEDLEKAISSRTKWFILNSPSNPSGSMYSESDLAGFCEVLLRNPHVMVLSDDIYEHITYDGKRFCSIASLDNEIKSRTFVLNGVSKAYSMTGWRIGYGAGPKDIIKAISTIQSQSTSNPCSISQYASIAALNGPQDFIESNNKLLAGRRDTALEILSKAPGISCNKPDGAFYLFPNCEGLIGRETPIGVPIKDSNDFAAYLLESAGVAVVPGSAFGMENFFRISYATSTEKLREGCARIVRACQDIA